MPYRKPAGLSRSANRKRIAYLQETGQGGYVPAGPVQARIRYLKDVRGITLGTIAQRCDVNLRMIKAHYLGYFFPGVPLETCFWRTEQQVMAARFTAADTYSVPPHGTQRRIQALAAAGFIQKFQAEQVGWSLARLNSIAKGRQGFTFVTVDVAAKVTGMYEKLEDAKPSDHGIDPIAVKRARNFARKNGWAPPGCWDPDTIDDPKAVPEWTGACGTAAGLRIHYREDIPPCPACLATRGEAGPRPRLDGRKLKALREKQGRTIRQVAERLGLTIDAVYAWEIGRSGPRSEELFDRLVTLMGCDYDDLCEEQ